MAIDCFSGYAGAGREAFFKARAPFTTALSRMPRWAQAAQQQTGACHAGLAGQRQHCQESRRCTVSMELLACSEQQAGHARSALAHQRLACGRAGSREQYVRRAFTEKQMPAHPTQQHVEVHLQATKTVMTNGLCEHWVQDKSETPLAHLASPGRRGGCPSRGTRRTSPAPAAPPAACRRQSRACSTGGRPQIPVAAVFRLQTIVQLLASNRRQGRKGRATIGGIIECRS